MTPRGQSRFFSNTVALVFQTVLATLITLVQVKVLATHLTQGDFGLFASLRGLSLLLSMLAANGLPQLLVRFLPVHEADGSRAAGARLSILAFVIGGGVAVALCAGVHIFRDAVFAFGGHDLDPSLFIWFYATTLGVTLKMILFGALNGARRLVVQSWLEVLSLTAILLWVWLTRDTLTVASLFRILGLVQIASVLVALPIYFGWSGAVSSDAAVETGGRGYRSYWLWASCLSLVALAFTDVDRYLLAHVLTFEALALFHIASRVARLANRMLGVANLSMQPEISRLDAESRTDSIRSATAIFLKFNALVSFVLVVGIVAFARDIIVIVASREYLPAVSLLVVLAAALPLTSMTAPLTTAMKATAHVKSALWVDLAWAGAYVALIFAAGRVFGLLGVGAAHVAAGLVQLLLAIRLSKLGITTKDVAELSAKLVAAAAVGFIPLIAVSWLGSTSWIMFTTRVIAFAVGCFLFNLLSRRFGVFSDYERDAIGTLFRSRGLGTIARLYS